MHFTSTDRTVLVKKSSTEFQFKYREGFTARIAIDIECEQGFGGEPQYTGRVFLFANGTSTDTYLHYTMSASRAEDLFMLFSLAPTPRTIAMTVCLQSDEYVHRDSGLPICEDSHPVEAEVWAAFRAEAVKHRRMS